MRRRVVVTGLGVASALGNDMASFRAALLAGRSGVQNVRREVGGLAIETCAAPVSFDPAEHFTKLELMSLDRVGQLSVLAARQALSNWSASAAERRRAGVYFGCGMGGGEQIETTYRDLFLERAGRVRPLTVVNVMANAPAAHIAMRYGLGGSNQTFSTACASSAIALGEACRAIRHGYLDAAVAGGAEALLVFGSLHGWQALGTLAKPCPGPDSTPAAACRPFSVDRTGLVLGEGAAVLLLEAEDAARARQAVILGEIVGYGANCDATHLSKPDAAGQAEAMRAALQDAGLDAGRIGYINAHGTATLAGDLSETAAIKAVFGPHAPPVSATKPLHGHTLGAAGALEALATLCALDAQVLPPTLNLERPDPACDLDYVPLHARPARFEYALSNSFAFGGSNASLIFARHA